MFSQAPGSVPFPRELSSPDWVRRGIQSYHPGVREDGNQMSGLKKSGCVLFYNLDRRAIAYRHVSRSRGRRRSRRRRRILFIRRYPRQILLGPGFRKGLTLTDFLRASLGGASAFLSRGPHALCFPVALFSLETPYISLEDG